MTEADNDLDPELLARMKAAADADGVIRDRKLADEYFQALVASNERKAEGRVVPQPDKEPVFPRVRDGRPILATDEEWVDPEPLGPDDDAIDVTIL